LSLIFNLKSLFYRLISKSIYFFLPKLNKRRSVVKRREFLKSSAATACGLSVSALPGGLLTACTAAKALLYKISLAEWSFHKALFAGEMDHLDFSISAKRDFNIEGVEYVNQFFMDKAEEKSYLGEMKKRAEDAGVNSLLIMCDGEGHLGDADETQRLQAVENHYKWVDAARFLGCHSIRVNAASEGTFAEQQKLAADGLRRLCEYGDKNEINVIVENHGGLSSNGKWLSGVMNLVDHPRCGTLPDFGNFRVSQDEEYDRYQGVRELMPFAKAVSAKSHQFDAQGNEINTDYLKMMQIVIDAGYKGFVGIEYEGSELSEAEGIKATQKLLQRVREQLS
jgi:sugar phosphate isomerase/epimerase